MPRVPDPHALRRDRRDDPAWTRLTPRDPAAAVPDFPLDSPTDRDLHWWQDAWNRPQANEWEKGEEHNAVALFARLMTRAEQPNAPVTVMRPLMQLREELGLSTTGLRRRRWLMPDEISAAAPATVTPIRPVGGTNRDRSGTADTPALGLLSKWRTHGVTFPPDTKQHADAVAELAARGIDLDPYEYLDQRGA